MSSLSRDSRFNMGARTGKNCVRSLFEWLVETFIQRWPTKKDLDMPDIPWLNADKGILRLREIAMLEWICWTSDSTYGIRVWLEEEMVRCTIVH